MAGTKKNVKGNGMKEYKVGNRPRVNQERLWIADMKETILCFLTSSFHFSLCSCLRTLYSPVSSPRQIGLDSIQMILCSSNIKVTYVMCDICQIKVM